MEKKSYIPANLQPPNATQDYQQNTQPMIGCYWLYYLCYSEFGLHFQQVEYFSIVGLMFDIHHFGFCSSGCLFFDADRLFRAVASPYFKGAFFRRRPCNNSCMAKQKIQTTIKGSINIQSAKGNSKYLENILNT
jgi:hypothetical protein